MEWKLLLEGVLALVLGNRVSLNVELNVTVGVIVAREENENGGTYGSFFSHSTPSPPPVASKLACMTMYR